jgi:hypothetical protein
MRRRQDARLNAPTPLSGCPRMIAAAEAAEEARQNERRGGVQG